MARLIDNGTVVSDDGEWKWNPEGGSIKGGAWDRIAPMTKKPGLATRLLVKKSAWGKPGLSETQEANRLQPSTGSRKISEIGERLTAEAERRKEERH